MLEQADWLSLQCLQHKDWRCCCANTAKDRLSPVDFSVTRSVLMPPSSPYTVWEQPEQLTLCSITAVVWGCARRLVRVFPQVCRSMDSTFVTPPPAGTRDLCCPNPQLGLHSVFAIQLCSTVVYNQVFFTIKSDWGNYPTYRILINLQLP